MVVSVIAASHALAGRPGEAQRAMKHLRELDPTLRVSNLVDWLPIRLPLRVVVHSAAIQDRDGAPPNLETEK
jgi:hypothetical protein